MTRYESRGRERTGERLRNRRASIRAAVLCTVLLCLSSFAITPIDGLYEDCCGVDLVVAGNGTRLAWIAAGGSCYDHVWEDVALSGGNFHVSFGDPSTQFIDVDGYAIAEDHFTGEMRDWDNDIWCSGTHYFDAYLVATAPPTPTATETPTPTPDLSAPTPSPPTLVGTWLLYR